MSRAAPRQTPATFARFQPRSRADWRRWLARHHEDAPGVWLVYLKGANRNLAYDASVEEALCFGWIDSLMQPIDGERYMQLFTPRKPKSNWSRLNKNRVETLLAAGLMAAAGLAAVAIAKQNGSWTALDAVESLTVPPDLARALRGNRAAKAAFASLSPSSKKAYLSWIHDAKRDETRAKRIAESVALIAQGSKGPQMRPK